MEEKNEQGVEIIDWGESEEEIPVDVRKKKAKKKQEPEEPFDLKKEIISWVKIVVFAMLAAIIIDHVIIVNAEVPTGSMENTIMTDSRMVGFRWSYAFDDPKRCDIIIFKFPDDPSQNYVKRVIGLPGEKVKVQDGVVYINGKALSEDYTVFKDRQGNKSDPYAMGDFEEVVVPENSYFVLGDNRNNSSDSRFWNTTNFVPRKNILGKAKVCYWHDGPRFDLFD